MKSTGIVRKVDELGRVVIPIELRRTLGIAQKDALEIYVDEDKIILKKYMPNMTCSITGDDSDDNLRLIDGKLIFSPEGAEQLIKEIQDSLKKIIRITISVTDDKTKRVRNQNTGSPMIAVPGCE